MCVRQDQDSPLPPQHETASALFGVNTFKAERQDDERRDDREETWNRRLRSLEEWICELLIRNQELRMSLRNENANNDLWGLSEGDIYDSPP